MKPSLAWLVKLSFALLLAHAAMSSLRELEGPVLLDPYAPAFACSTATLRGLAYLRLLLAALVLWSRSTRPALLLSGLIALYTLFANTLDFHNNRYALALYALAAGVALARTGVTALGLTLMRAQCMFIYLVSALSKLLDPDWAGGAVLRARFVWFEGLATARGVPAGVMHVLQGARISQAISLGAISTELFLAVGLWLPRTRLVATCVGVAFHVIIQLTAKVETFSWLTLTVYAAFWMRPPRAAA